MDEKGRQDILARIRKEFYALRNGMIADVLRKGGLEQKYIFGLQLPQIKGIADRYRPEDEREAAEIARRLWADRDCREARLLACHLMPPSQTDKAEASRWAEETATREETDILAFRLLRHLPYSADIAVTLDSSEDTLKKYTASAIRRFL